MGCGVSKFDKDEMSRTYLYCNPLHCRFDDLSPWRHKGDRAASAADHTSTEQLLAEEADSLSSGASNDHDRKSVSKSFPQVNNKASTGDPSHVGECVVNLPPSPQQMEKAGGGGDGRGKEEEPGGGDKKGSGERHESDNYKEKGNNKKDEEEECNLGLSDRENNVICPGSPSFRVYCFLPNDTSADADSTDCAAVIDDHITDNDHGESGVDRPRDSVGIESEKEEKPSPVDSVKRPDEPAARTQSGKKSRRPGGRRFRVGLPGNASPGMRGIWHISSCNPHHRTAGNAS